MVKDYQSMTNEWGSKIQFTAKSIKKWPQEGIISLIIFFSASLARLQNCLFMLF